MHDSWSSRLSALATLVQRVEDAASPEAFTKWTYQGLSASLARLNARRIDILAMLIALAPFDVRDLPSEHHHDHARHPSPGAPTAADILGSGLLAAVDEVIDAVLDAIEDGVEPPPVPTVPTIAVEDRGTALALTFGMSTVPVDGDGSFSASRVFEAHKYANAQLE